jgi:hypothetical protein
MGDHEVLGHFVIGFDDFLSPLPYYGLDVIPLVILGWVDDVKVAFQPSDTP